MSRWPSSFGTRRCDRWRVAGARGAPDDDAQRLVPRRVRSREELSRARVVEADALLAYVIQEIASPMDLTR